MKVLVLFDGDFDFSKIPSGADHVDLFPLTGDWRFIYSLEEWCLQNGLKSISLDSARFVDEQVHDLKKRISAWSLSVGETRVAGRTIKEWFHVPGFPISSWWFSSMAERNNIKEPSFLRIAQWMAIAKVLKENRYDMCVSSLASHPLHQALKIHANRQSTQMVFRRIKRREVSLLQRGRMLFDTAGLWAHCIQALLNLAIFTRQCLMIKSIMGPLCGRRANRDGNVVVTYYPYLDRDALLEGKFHNTYLGPLQRKIDEMGQKINWICMVVPVNQWTFNESIRQAKVLAAAGESLFFIYEFVSIPVVLRCVAIWVWQSLKALALPIGRKTLFSPKEINLPEVSPILRSLWIKSFCGWNGLESLLYLDLFKRMGRYFPSATRCIYVSEMHAWEKALNTASKKIGWRAKTIGFQHAAISKNHYFYSPLPEEIVQHGRRTDFPLPDVMAANGKVPYDQLFSSSFPRLVQMEAVRQLSMAAVLKDQSVSKESPPVLVLVGSYSFQESCSLLNLLVGAWEDTPPCQVWFKPHPSMDWDRTLKQCKIPWPQEYWEIRFDPIQLLFKKSSVVVVGESSLAIEALAYGCTVVSPALNDVAFMSPLDGHEAFYEKIYSPMDLQKIVARVLKTPKPEEQREAAHAFAVSYWDLNPALPRWGKILQEGSLNAPA